jgi:methionine-rich copper-binding protein CopC
MTSAAKRYLQALAAGLILVVLAAAPALGHADLLSTNPAEGETLSASPQVIELVFTAAIQPIGDGVRLLTSDGALVAATVDQPDAERVALVPADELANGGYIVEWTVTSEDSHIIDGTLSFDVAVPATEAVTPDEEPVDPPAQEEAVTATALSATDLYGDSGGTVGEWVARLGRWAAMVGALVAIGAFAFSWTAFSGSEREVRGLVRWIGAAGAVIVVGALMEAVGASMVRAAASGGGLSIDAMSETLSGSYRWAIALRLSGGALLMWGVSPVATPYGSVEDSDRLEVSGSAGGSTDLAVSAEPTTVAYRLSARGSIAGLVGVGLVAVSYLFDGHTVTASPSVVARSADLLHVVGSGVWFGGLVTMAWLFAREITSNPAKANDWAAAGGARNV